MRPPGSGALELPPALDVGHLAFVDGELVGGCDIVMEMYQSGELQQVLGMDPGAPSGEAPAAEAESAPPLQIENRL